MKKLVTVKDVEELIKQEKKVLYLEEGAIITSSAQDAARLNNVTFEINISGEGDTQKEEIDKEMLYKVCKAMIEEGLLKGVACGADADKPYMAKCDKNGLKMIKGDTVKLDVLDPENPNANAWYQELVGKDEAHISAGFLVIENCRFDWTLDYEEIDYVIEGTLTIEIDGETFVGHPGDVLFVPSGSKVVWGSPDKVKLFYATYPANWSDFL